MFVATLILSALLAVAFLGAGAPKLAGRAAAVADVVRLGLPERAARGIGALEVAGAAGLLIGLAFWPLGAAAAIGLALLMAGAVVAHLRAGDGAKACVPALAFALPAVALAVVRVLSA